MDTKWIVGTIALPIILFILNKLLKSKKKLNQSQKQSISGNGKQEQSQSMED